MSSRLIQLLSGVLVALIVGIFAYPLFYPLPKKEVAPPKPVVKEETPAPVQPVVKEESVVEELDDDDFDLAVEDESDDTEDDEEEVVGEGEADSFMPVESGLAEEVFREDDVPEDEAQQHYVAPGVASRHTAAHQAGGQLAKQLEKQTPKDDSKRFIRQEFGAERWQKPEEIYQELSERIMGKLGKLEEGKEWTYLQDPANRLDLAVLRMIYLAGEEGIREVAAQPEGADMLATLSGDLEWMNGLLYSGPTQRMEQALAYLATLYAKHSKDIVADPVARRIATTTALEFAREGWAEREMTERYAFFYESYKANKLNASFKDLQYWDTRLVTGCVEPGQNTWGSVRSMAWQQDNVRLPARGYLDACYLVEYRMNNVAGDSVHGSDYLAPILKYTNNTMAWAHREIGGVCGALSHFGAYGALATGLPAITMGEPGHCAMTVRVNGKWEKGNSIFWEHGLHKTFWKEFAWDFLILMQKLYDDRYRTMASDHMVAMGDVLSARRKVYAASRCYEQAVSAQPLNWPAWLRCLGYMKLKAPKDAAKWAEMNDLAADTLGKEFHHATATLLSKYVYPTLFENVTDRRALNTHFARFFRHCKRYGNNRWDIAPLLNAQMASCTSSEEKLAYMKDALQTLMGNPDYAGAVLSWGLEAIADMQGDEAMQEKFTGLIVRALSKAGTSGKNMDATWAALGEAIATAAAGGDRKTFQEIGKLASRKCKKNFPRNKFRIRAIPGKIVSQTGLLAPKDKLSDEQRAQACMLWAVLQKQGGAMPFTFGGAGNCLCLQLEHECALNGLVCVFKEELKATGNFVIESSTDGQNWTAVTRNPSVSGNMLRVDCRELNKTARHVRIWLDGAEYKCTLAGFYVYGKAYR